MVQRGIDRLRSGTGERGVSVRLEPIFDSIYELGDDEFLELVEQLGFVYGYEHEGTEDSETRLCARLMEGIRTAREEVERDIGD